MPENVLNAGDSRIGWLYDDNEATPHLAVMLQNTGDQFVMSVPFRDMGSQHARWFGQGINYGDDPHRTRFAYEPPEQLMFQDPRGQVVLVGCRPDGFNTTAFSAGVGRIVPNFLVLGARNLKYETLNGLRSEIPWVVELERDREPETVIQDKEGASGPLGRDDGVATSSQTRSNAQLHDAAHLECSESE